MDHKAELFVLGRIGQVGTVRSLSEELSTDLLDNYQNLGINSENHGLYLLDQVHPNAACRYLMGKNLILQSRYLASPAGGEIEKLCQGAGYSRIYGDQDGSP